LILADFAEYAAALVVPLLLVGATLAIVVAGLATVFQPRSRFLRVAYASLGVLLAISSAWLVLYATGADTYYHSDVSRWDHAQRFMGTWPVSLAIVCALATSIVLFASAASRARGALNLMAAPAAALACFLLIFGWFALTAGH
jgi:disulfide bond formation protein DsbB